MCRTHPRRAAREPLGPMPRCPPAEAHSCCLEYALTKPLTCPSEGFSSPRDTQNLGWFPAVVPVVTSASWTNPPMEVPAMRCGLEGHTASSKSWFSFPLATQPGANYQPLWPSGSSSIKWSSVHIRLAILFPQG